MTKVLIIIFGLFVGIANASEKPQFHIGVEDINYYPVMDFSNEQPKGLLFDIMHQFGKEEGILFEFIPLPLLRFPYWFEENTIDLRLPDNQQWSAKRTPGLYYSDVIISLCDTTVVLTENRDILFDDVKRLGLLKGFTPAKKWQQRRKEGSVIVAKERTVRSLTRMLLNGFVDAIDLNIATIRSELNALNLPEDLVSVAQNIPAKGVTYHISTQNQPEIINTFNAFLAKNEKAIENMATAYGIVSGKSCENITN